MRILLAAAALLLLGGGALAQTPPEPEPRHGIAMHGEPKYGPDFQHFDYVNPDAPVGGVLRMHALGSFDSLNPYIVKGSAPVGSTLPFETLMTGSHDEPFSEYGLIAESIQVPEDRSWVTFTLREEARWHDGTPITVEDVIFSLETLKQQGLPFFRLYYGSVEKAEKVGPRQVKFTFTEGENRELPLIVGQMPILPRHYWEGRDFGSTTLEPPLGSGPYRVADFEPGRYIVYERVEDYWGWDLPVRKGWFNFERIRYDYYRDSTVALQAFKAGQYHYRPENESKKWATEYDFPAVADGRVKTEEFPHERPAGMQGFVFNMRRPLFQDERVRRALAYAFDFEWTNENLFYGQYERTKSYFANSELAAEGLPSEAELAVLEPLRDQLPPEVFTEIYEPPASDGSGNIRPNLRTAMRLLNDAGWEVRDGRLVNVESGRPFTFEILLVQPTWERISLPFVRNLERLGIQARVRTVDTAQYENRIENFDFDMIVDVWGQSLSPGNEQRLYWTCAAAESPGSRNSPGICDPAVDALVEQVIAAPDRESLVARTRALDRALLWGHYVIPHWHIGYDRVAYWDRFGRPDEIPMLGVQVLSWWSKAAETAAAPAGRSTAGMVSPAQAQQQDEGLDTPARPPVQPDGTLTEEAERETAPADEAVPTPAAESPGVSPWLWLALVAAVVVLFVMHRRRGRDRS